MTSCMVMLPPTETSGPAHQHTPRWVAAAPSGPHSFLDVLIRFEGSWSEYRMLEDWWFDEWESEPDAGDYLALGPF
jgi:hypothetical protein